MTDTPQVLLAHHLKTLKLPTFLREYDKVARQCAAEGVDYPRYLLRLAELELIDRERRTIERRIKAAKFPTVKSLDSFDFAAFPSLNKALVMELARSEYVARRENIIAVGNSGTGKTHVGLGLGLAFLRRRQGQSYQASLQSSAQHAHFNAHEFAAKIDAACGLDRALATSNDHSVASARHAAIPICRRSARIRARPAGAGNLGRR